MYKFNDIFLTDSYFSNGDTSHESVFTFGKGGGGSTDPEQDALEKEEISFDTTLQGIFSQQYAQQSANLQFLNGQLEPEIKNPTGYTPTQLANLRTNATDTNSEQYQNAEQALNNEVSQNSGGSKLTGVAGAN